MQLRWDYFRDKYTDIEECNDLDKIDQLLLYRTGILGASLEKVVRFVGEYFISMSNYNSFRITNCQKPCTYMRYYKTKVGMLMIIVDNDDMVNGTAYLLTFSAL